MLLFFVLICDVMVRVGGCFITILFYSFSILHFSHPERRSWCHGTFSFQFLYMFSMCLVPKLVHMIGFCSRFKKRVVPQMFQCACMHFFYFNISTNSLLFPCLVFSPKSWVCRMFFFNLYMAEIIFWIFFVVCRSALRSEELCIWAASYYRTSFPAVQTCVFRWRSSYRCCCC